MKIVKLTDANNGKMPLGDLWKELGRLVDHINDDNTNYDGEYPVDARKIQMESIVALISAISAHHNDGGVQIHTWNRELDKFY